MRISILILVLGLVAVSMISLILRVDFFVRVISLFCLFSMGMLGLTLTRKMDQRKKAWTILLVGSVAWFGLALANAPLRMVFAWYQPEFEASARALLRGDRMDFPMYIGPFRLVDGGIRDRGGEVIPYLMTSGWESEINGFAREPQGKYFNLWAITPLDKNWAYIEED